MRKVKIIHLILCLFLLLAFVVACNKSNTDNPTPTPDPRVKAWDDWNKVEPHSGRAAEKPELIDGFSAVFVDVGESVTLPDGKDAVFEIYSEEKDGSSSEKGNIAYVLTIGSTIVAEAIVNDEFRVNSAYAIVVVETNGSEESLTYDYSFSFAVQFSADWHEYAVYKPGLDERWIDGRIDSMEKGYLTVTSPLSVIHSPTQVQMKYSCDFFGKAELTPSNDTYICIVGEAEEPLVTLAELSVYAVNEDGTAGDSIALPTGTAFYAIETNLTDTIKIKTTDGEGYLIMNCEDYFASGSEELLNSLFSGRSVAD